ncbi:MAG: iron-containing alcohol dehydrogenase [Chitinispirillaceae bacterium]|nr:iron-containing alcohol dehydrogenase [Chitinispirillaceae bacterium]
MLVVHVFVQVKTDQIDAFKNATIENARSSLQEPGIARFDVIQQADDPAGFVLVEAYRSPHDMVLHKETLHYQSWRDTVADMMAVPLGGMYGAPHGTVCALLLPHVMEANVKALRERCPGSPALTRYASAAQLLAENPAATAADGIAWIKSLCADLPLPAPGSLNIERKLFPEIAAAARRASSLKGNPVELTEEELTGVLEAAFA